MPFSSRSRRRRVGARDQCFFEQLESRLNLAGDDFVPIYLHQDVEGIESTVESRDGFGSVLAKGNFDGDDLLDLAISVPGEDGEGAVAILYNNGQGLSPLNDQLWTAESLLGDQAKNARFATTLAAGDFDGDGHLPR